MVIEGILARKNQKNANEGSGKTEDVQTGRKASGAEVRQKVGD